MVRVPRGYRRAANGRLVKTTKKKGKKKGRKKGKGVKQAVTHARKQATHATSAAKKEATRLTNMILRKLKQKQRGKGIGKLAITGLKTLGPAIAAGLVSDLVVNKLIKGKGLRM